MVLRLCKRKQANRERITPHPSQATVPDRWVCEVLVFGRSLDGRQAEDQTPARVKSYQPINMPGGVIMPCLPGETRNKLIVAPCPRASVEDGTADKTLLRCNGHQS